MDMGRTDIEHKMNMNENLNSINLLQKYNKKNTNDFLLITLIAAYSNFDMRYNMHWKLIDKNQILLTL